MLPRAMTHTIANRDIIRIIAVVRSGGSMKCDAIAYIEWGGVYDARELKLIEHSGKFHYEDLTGGYMTIHHHLKPRSSVMDAKAELLRFVFDLGESSTYVDFGSEIIRKRDYTRMNQWPYLWLVKPPELIYGCSWYPCRINVVPFGGPGNGLESVFTDDIDEARFKKRMLLVRGATEVKIYDTVEGKFYS